ncbi:putative NAD(FAD)-dependent dehydrogenase [Streptococcus lutetiensis]|nr:putative NAD(FAD)-dependent dehydrogenase [Streptococcus lutetiensis]
MEFTYAPPFGAAKDPVNMAGYAALNIIEGVSESIQWYELADELAKGMVFLDVRTKAEVARGYIANGINIPLDSLRDSLSELDPNKEYIISCHSSLRSYIGEHILKQNGFKGKNLDEAYHLYSTVKPEEIKRD